MGEITIAEKERIEIRTPVSKLENPLLRKSGTTNMEDTANIIQYAPKIRE